MILKLTEWLKGQAVSCCCHWCCVLSWRRDLHHIQSQRWSHCCSIPSVDLSSLPQPLTFFPRLLFCPSPLPSPSQLGSPPQTLGVQQSMLGYRHCCHIRHFISLQAPSPHTRPGLPPGDALLIAHGFTNAGRKGSRQKGRGTGWEEEKNFKESKIRNQRFLGKMFSLFLMVHFWRVSLNFFYSISLFKCCCFLFSFLCVC